MPPSSMPPLALRPAGPADIAELVRLINAAYRVEDVFIRGDRTDAADVAARMAAPEAVFLVLDGDAPGMLAAAAYVTRREEAGHFALLSVDPARQGRGLGRAMVQAIESHCRAQGCRELRLDYVNLRDELPRFYTALGFEPTGETAPMSDPARLKRPAHLVLMRKSLVNLRA